VSRALLRVLVVAVAALSGCATISVYDYQPKPLPAGSQPLAVVAWSLQDLRNVSWSYGEPDPDPSRRAAVEATRTGLVALSRAAVAVGSPLDIGYDEIVKGVRMITESAGSWTVYVYDHQNRLIQMEFASYAAARLFLDAATALAAMPSVEVATIKN